MIINVLFNFLCCFHIILCYCMMAVVHFGRLQNWMILLISLMQNVEFVLWANAIMLLDNISSLFILNPQER